MARIKTLLSVASAGLLICLCSGLSWAGEPAPPGMPLDAILERAAAWVPQTDRLRPTAQARQTHGTPQGLCFEMPTDLGPFDEDLFSKPQGPRRSVRLPEEIDLGRFTRLTVWARQTGRRAAFIHIGLSAEPRFWGENLIRAYNSEPLDRGPWRRYTLNFHHLSPAERSRLRYLVVMAICVGNQPDEEPLTRIYLDDWRLEDPPQRKFQGWGADPDVVTVSQAGFRRFSEKVALVPEACAAGEFAIQDAESGKVVFRDAVETIEGPLGRYQVARFDRLSTPGRYRVSAGRFRSLRFRIADDVFAEPMRFAYRWLRDMRCGCATRRHMPCHLDDAVWKGKHYDVSGGWHDAGDVRTYWFHSAQVPITALRLHGLGHRCDDDHDGRDDFLDDAFWGVRHLVKVHDALGWFPMKIRDWPDYRRGNYWTDNVVGTPDDRHVIETPFDLDTESDVMTAAGLFAAGCRPEHRPQADRLLAIARERFEHFWDPETGKQKWRGERARAYHGYHQAHWVRGMLGLYQATQDPRYLEPLAHYGRSILACQKRAWPRGATRPLCGDIFSWMRGCRDRDLPEEVLALLCDSLGDHADWYDWHFALVRGVEHWHKPVRGLWRPFSLPQLEQQERFARSVQQSVGVKIVDDGPKSLYVVPFGGASDLPGTAASLMHVARSLNDPEIERLVTWQVQWALGHNPMNLSFIVDYGEDCVTQPYSFSQGRLPGSVTVTFGLEERGMPRHVRPGAGEVCVAPGRLLIEALGQIAAPAVFDIRLLDVRKPYPGEATLWWPRAEEKVGAWRTDAAGRLPSIRVPGGETYELRVEHPDGPVRLTLPAVSGNTYERTVDLAGHLVLAVADAPENVAPGQPFAVTVAVTNLGHGEASARVVAAAADCRIDGPTEQAVTVPGRATRQVTWKLISGEGSRPYLFRAELDGDHARGIDVTGTIGWKGPAAISPK